MNYFIRASSIIMYYTLTISYSPMSFLANFVFPNFLLNLSIRPAVSTNFILPVKNGCEAEEISTLTNGYSLPSFHFTVSLEGAHDWVINSSSQEMSLKTTFLYSAGCMSFFISVNLLFANASAKIGVFYRIHNVLEITSSNFEYSQIQYIGISRFS